MLEKHAVYVSFDNTNWALGLRFVSALREVGLDVVYRPSPGSVRAFLNRFRAGQVEQITVHDCSAMVVILTPAWASHLPPEPDFTAFQRLSEDDPSRTTIIVSTTNDPVPPWLERFQNLNYAKLGFRATTSKLAQWLGAPKQPGTLASTPPLPPTDPSPAASIIVFISYAHADREFEQRLLGDLQAAGIKVWVDHERLRSGTPDWEIAIRRGIAASDALIYIGSEDAMASGAVRSELEIAHDNSIPIHALWARGTTWSNCAPFRLVPAQYVDARGPKFASAV
jgi:hypothetical protein